MDDARQRDGKAVTAKIARQFVPSRIERQLLAQAFDLVSHDQPNLANVSAEWSEYRFLVAPRYADEANDDSGVTSIQLTGRSAA